MRWRALLPPLLIAALVGSALAVVWSKQAHRSALAQRQQQYGERDRLDTEFKQLRLEQATFASHARIERDAAQHLQMSEPDDYAIVLVPTDSR